MRALIPQKIISIYHWLMAGLAAVWFRFPANQMLVVGVTGTNGKSTTVNLLGRIFMAAGYQVGWSSTINFRVGEREWLNDKKMTMLGRFALQKLLRQMVRAGCQVAIIETSSEGILQYRHRFINYDAAVFTNLTPEHLERHGGFENYRAAKEKLFAHLTTMKAKNSSLYKLPPKADHPLAERIIPLRGIPRRGTSYGLLPKSIIVNADDPNVGYFVQYPADKKIAFRMADHHELPTANWQGVEIKDITEIILNADGSQFSFLGAAVKLPLLGKFNIQNAAAAMSVAFAYGVEPTTSARALGQITSLPGRLEIISAGQSFGIIVDYAPEPASFRALYDLVATISHHKIIHVFGSCGGGRDKARRPILGKIAAEQADVLIITNEDPYDEDPQTIINEVAAGAIPHLSSPLGRGRKLEKILDRRAAIAKALRLAHDGDLVLITGKGAEQAMAVAGGKHIPWDDRVVVREELNKIFIKR